MNILYLHQYFKTPSKPGSTRSYWLSKGLTLEGHNVKVVSSSLFSSQDRSYLNVDGIDVHYVKVPYDSKMSFIRRLMAFVQFIFKSTWVSLKQKDIDLIIATSTPLTIGVPALLMKMFKRVPYIFEVRDLWPEVPIQMGGLKNPILIKLSVLLEKLIYRNASHIVALSPGMKAGIIDKGVNEEKITVIPNMAKIDKFWPRERKIEKIKGYDFQNEALKVIHFGTMSLANGLDYIIEAAKILQTNGILGIHFILIGDGSQRSKLEKFVKDCRLKNVFFLGQYAMKETSEIVNACDLSICTFSDIPVLGTNSPNKLFDSLSAAKPVIVNSKGWTRDLVRNNNCGYYVDVKYPNSLAELLIKLKNNPSDILERGRNARNLAVEKYDKSILCNKFTDLVMKFENKPNNEGLKIGE